MASGRERLEVLTGRSIVWDNHACMPLAGKVDDHFPMLLSCHEAGVDVISLNVGMDSQSVGDHITTLSEYRRWFQLRPEKFILVSNADDIVEARRQGKLAISFDIEGMNALGGQLDMLGLYYDLGVRWMLVAYNHANAAGGGCLDDVDNGLTFFGRAVIAEMNRIGMVVCASHTGPRTALEAIDHSSSPVIFSHSNCKGVYNHPRNISDEIIKACAGRGGVVGVNGFGPFLGRNDASVSAMVRHIDYLLDLVGEDSVGIALDYVFDKAEMTDYILEHPDAFPAALGITADVKMVGHEALWEIAGALSKRGYSSHTLGKIFGGNHLRIAQSVWH